MRAATKKALLASIDHWRQNEKAATLNDILIGPTHCALCTRFWTGGRCTRSTPSTSEPCPVYKATGKVYCQNSPFDSCSKAYKDCDLRAFRRAAKKERLFLESLLPSSLPPAKS